LPIIADFPAFFAEFGGKRFALLWLGSRDGFGGHDFHRCCDGRAPTLTLIEDTEGDSFEGFTPVKWESQQWNRKHEPKDNRYKADSSLKSFLFLLKNPCDFSARKFALEAEAKDRAIECDSSRGPCFGSDISVSELQRKHR
jgi:hypothetical protein